MRRVTRDLDYIRDRTVVDPATSCWVWALRLNGHGYGRVQLSSSRTTAAHRVAWEAVHGPIQDGLFVCHHCDVRRCCNPDHLFLGTNQDNVDDREAKGRNNPPRGSAVVTSKLVEPDVAIIKTLLNLGVQGRRLATLYGVRRSTISLIKNGLRWAHIPAAEAAKERVR